MALVGGGGWGEVCVMREGEVCVMRSQGIAASPVSLLSMGGVCGQSLINGGRNFLHWNASMLSLFSIMTLWLDCLLEALRRFDNSRVQSTCYES